MASVVRVHRSATLRHAVQEIRATTDSSAVTVDSEDRLPPPTSHPIDLNRATRADLETLPGIGPILARAIVEYRELHGGFKNKKDLTKILGIGKKTFEAVRELIIISEMDSAGRGSE